jgi:DNA mismatch endonuclease (patch repair protein)
MRAIRSTGMKPEMLVRRLVHSLGYRYRLHRHDLPGRPDLVFSRSRKIIFVHGCFWHQHPGCKLAHRPRSNLDYWTGKLARNVARDVAHLAALKKDGWKVLVIWECQTKKDARLAARVRRFLAK